MNYSLDDYAAMIDDPVRMDAYAYALKLAVGPDSVVLDIGTATGIHALLACKFGAKKVYAVEPNGLIHLAQEMAKVNGFGERIEFIHDLSTNISLPEPADIVVSDLRGQLPLYGQHISAIVDACNRHLAENGALIPQRDRLWVGLVEGEPVYNNIVKPWDSPYGLNMEPARQLALNNMRTDDTDFFQSRHLLVRPVQWHTLDYETIENGDVSSSQLVASATRDGTAHGLLIWFDAELAEGVHFSNAPDVEQISSVYGRGFFPLNSPVPIAKDDVITMQITAELAGEDYVWHWHTRITDGNDPSAVKAEFRQSTDIEKNEENNGQHCT